MALNQDASTALVRNFKGSAQAVDVYNIDADHGLYSQNVDFIVSPTGVVQATSRRGTSQVLQCPITYGAITSAKNWCFTDSAASYHSALMCYAPAVGATVYSGTILGFIGSPVGPTGAASMTTVGDGNRLFMAFVNTTGTKGTFVGHVYNYTYGDSTILPPGITTAVATVALSQPSSGVITAGLHRVAYIFTTNFGFVSVLNPIDSSGVFAPTSFTAADGVHNLSVAINFLSLPSYLTGGETIQIAMTSAANPAQYYIVPGATGVVPVSGTVTINCSITDNDLVEGTDATEYQNKLCAIGSAPAFYPTAIFAYSARLGYITTDSAGFPVVYFSDQNAYQSMTAAYSGIYFDGKQIPVQGASLGGVCYIGTLSGLYSTTDNGGLPATWTPPARVDGSVGILAPGCILSSSGRLLVASEKGLFVFGGGVFPQVPLSYWQYPDWSRINWADPTQLQIVDDVNESVIRVLAALKVVITAATNTSPISITTAVLIGNKPVAYPHLFQTGLSVTISGISGNTNANTTAVITVTGPNTFTIPVAGNGAYVAGSDGWAGTAAPNTPNAIMTWNYAIGDTPDTALYSIHAFAAYRAGAMALVRDLFTNIDETWFAPSAGNPGGLLRRTLPTDTSIHQDVDLSGSASAISSLYETAPLPLDQDQNQNTIHDFHGMHARISGKGSLALVCYGLDHVRSVVPTASPVALSQNPGAEILVKWFLRSEQQTIQFGTNAVDAYFIAALLRVYWTPAMQQR
jgi:hypothetical protein